jgi:threonine/homoserine/homoserine lactone efflux protein
MFGIHDYPGFVLSIVAFQIVPGPGTLTILNATARHGVRSGMGAVLGTLTGDFLFMLGAVLGLAAVLVARPVFWSTLQWLGILYLCWFGLKLLLTPEVRDDAHAEGVQHHWTSFREAFAVCLTNPKAIVFFMSFFPLFLTRDARPLTLGVMMAHVTLISLIYQTGLVLVGDAVTIRLSRFRHARILTRRLVGLGLLGFGFKLAVNRK